MPMYCKNIIVIEGSEERKRALLEYIEGDGAFDFKKVAPIPVAYDGIEVDELIENMAAEALKMPHPFPSFDFFYADGTPCEKHESAIKGEALIKEGPLSLDEAQWQQFLKRLDLLYRYGSSDSFHWRVAHWGTKWNAGDVQIVDDSISFTTAWCFPFPILEELTRRFPDIGFYACYALEDLSACAAYLVKGGEVVKKKCLDEDDESTAAVASKVWAGEGVPL